MLLFARGGRAESAAKPALGGRHARRACGLMLERVRAAARASGLPVVEWGQHRQRGASFGARLAHGVAHALGLGYAHVVVVGGDCPELRPADLLAAAAALATGREVIGRDRRGGAYLLGVAGERFAAARFAALPWETDRLAAAFAARAERLAAGLTELTPRGDVNDAADLRRAARRLRGFRGWAALLARSRPRAGASPGQVLRVAAGFGDSPGLRGPPVAG